VHIVLGGRWGRRQVSMSLWYPGLHTWYNGHYNGLRRGDSEQIF